MADSLDFIFVANSMGIDFEVTSSNSMKLWFKEDSEEERGSNTIHLSFSFSVKSPNMWCQATDILVEAQYTPYSWYRKRFGE